jgi:hypothetical protein
VIARDSTSFPYLAIAQHTGAPYAYVLALADALEVLGTDGYLTEQNMTVLATVREDDPESVAIYRAVRAAREREMDRRAAA